VEKLKHFVSRNRPSTSKGLGIETDRNVLQRSPAAHPVSAADIFTLRKSAPKRISKAAQDRLGYGERPRDEAVRAQSRRAGRIPLDAAHLCAWESGMSASRGSALLAQHYGILGGL
jgi:hypothetical protein